MSKTILHALFVGCTIAEKGRKSFALTLFIGFAGVLMVSVAPVFLKYFIDTIGDGGSKQRAAIYIALMLSAFALGSILYELKWLFYTRSDRYNYLGHISKLLARHPDATAMRLHRAAQSNGKYLAILFLTLLPISVETLLVGFSVAFISNTALAACLLGACSIQMCLVLARTTTLNPLFTVCREREFEYFHKLEQSDERAQLSRTIHAWYDAVSTINRARYRLRAVSLLPVVAAMGVANGLALYHWSDSVTIGALAALNTCFMQISAKIEMLGNSLREALNARNQMQMPDA